MNIKDYDAWKLLAPEDDYGNGGICPFCGAYATKSCELEEENGGICPWKEAQPDPDYQRDLRDSMGD